ncbi:MAG: DUF4405 domain-containing protein [Paracoccus sp. (in: a-proteobacteria)]
MSQLFNRYATPLTTGLFLVSLMSGIALFFHIGLGGFHPMHEWLSMVLILPFVLHIWRNWRPFIAYFRHAPMLMALALSVLSAGWFLLPSDDEGRRGGPPQFAFAHLVLQSSPAELAPVLNTTPETLIAQLAAQGIPAAADQSLIEAASTAGKTEADLYPALSVSPGR